MALNVVEIWRDLHKTPELGFEENKTSAYRAAVSYTHLVSSVGRVRFLAMIWTP